MPQRRAAAKDVPLDIVLPHETQDLGYTIRGIPGWKSPENMQLMAVIPRVSSPMYPISRLA